MLSRAVLILLASFWVTMNVLLWRAEFGPDKGRRNAVPVELVWRRMLASPDSSSLNIYYRGRRVGFCRWVTGVGEEWAEVTDETVPSGMPKKVRSYRLQLDGTALLPESADRIRFEGSLKVNAHHAWQELDAGWSARRLTWRVHSAAAAGTVELSVAEGGTRLKHTFRFSELEHPAALLSGWLGPLAGEAFKGEDVPAPGDLSPAAAGVKWEAYEDTLRIGHSQVHVFLLETRLLDRYPVSVVVSRVGEILRVSLPDQVTLVNDQLAVL